MINIPINTEKAPTLISELVLKLKIRDVMNKGVVTATKSSTLRTIQRLMKEKRITGVPIIAAEKLLGIISMDDIVNALDHGYIEEKAEKHMTTDLIVLEDDMPLSFAISYFDKFKYGRFPVVDKQRNLVGMVTRGDIISNLLVEVTKEVDELEKKIEKPETVELSLKHKEYKIAKYDFANAGKPSNEIKKILKDGGMDPKLLRRIAITSYELEMNIVVHTLGGKLIVDLNDDYIEITAKDPGPGIADVDKALQEGFSTAEDWIRSLGFGAGMGLPNVKRVSDEFEIKSIVGKGTTVRSRIYLKPRGGKK
jgi:CBS domain-containing protein